MVLLNSNLQMSYRHFVRALLYHFIMVKLRKMSLFTWRYLKIELEFEEQKLRILTKSAGVFYEASFYQSNTKTYNFDKSGEGKDIL